MSILEAMSVGLLILSTQISGISDILKNGYNGFLLEPGDIDGFYNKILWMEEHPIVLEKYIMNSKKIVSNFLSDYIFRELIDIYIGMLGEIHLWYGVITTGKSKDLTI